MRKYLKQEFHQVFLLLGKDCNLRCKYCLQACFDHPDPNMGRKDLVLVTDFLRDISENQEENLRVVLYGGEPLLHFDDIQKVVCGLRDADIAFGMITNGKLLTQEVVDFLNTEAKCSGVTISWDGFNVEKTRHYDVMKEKWDLILQLKNAGISGVCTKYAYPKDMVDAWGALKKEWDPLHPGHTMRLNIDRFIDVDNPNTEELLADPAVIQEQMTDMVQHVRRCDDGKTYNLYYVEFVRSCFDGTGAGTRVPQVPFGTINRCGAGHVTLNLDMMGNLYKCHNDCNPLCTVKDSYWRLLRKSIESELALEFTRTHCKDCYIGTLCSNGGCALLKPEGQSTMCESQRAFFTPIMDYMKERGLV